MIWESTVDNGEFHVGVFPTEDDYLGKLVVMEVETEKVLLEQEVGLSYGAIFGPDVSDVYHWQEISIRAIDAHIAERNNDQ